MKDKETEKKVVKDFEAGLYREVKGKKKIFQKMAYDTEDRSKSRIGSKVKAKFVKT